MADSIAELLLMACLPLLVTSLPPRMSRLRANGEDFGAAYQQACIDSWYDASFDPVSINSTEEDYPHAIRSITVNRDASAVTGRPHVYLEDMLTAAVAQTNGRPFCITNADIRFSLNNDLHDCVMSLRPGEVIFSRRVDIDNPDCNEGIPYPFGFDFFAVHPDDTTKLSTHMVFGAPWWDQLFPLMMYLLGCNIRQSDPKQFLHLKHEDRWSWPIWEALGQRCLKELTAESNDETFRLRLRDAVHRNTGRFASDFKYSIWKRLPKNSAGESVRLLHRVSNANVTFLDEVSCHRDEIYSST